MYLFKFLVFGFMGVLLRIHIFRPAIIKNQPCHWMAVKFKNVPTPPMLGTWIKVRYTARFLSVRMKEGLALHYREVLKLNKTCRLLSKGLLPKIEAIFSQYLHHYKWEILWIVISELPLCETTSLMTPSTLNF